MINNIKSLESRATDNDLGGGLMLNQRTIMGGIITLAFIFLLFYYLTVYRFIESTDDAYVQADVTWISPKIGGDVVDILVKNNQVVNKGQMLMKIDDSDIKVREEMATANLKSRQALKAMQGHEMVEAKSKIAQEKSKLVVAQAEFSRMKLELSRYQTLFNQGITSQQNFESVSSQFRVAEANLYTAEEAVRALNAKLEQLIAARDQTQAEIDAADASVRLLSIDRSSTSMVAPISGVIGNLELKVGTRVSPQGRLMAIVALDSAYIEANFKETQIHQLTVGQEVKVRLDAYPGKELRGYIESFSPAAGTEFSVIPVDNAAGNFNKIVQRVPIRIRLDKVDSNILLRAGLSAIVTVDTRQKS